MNAFSPLDSWFKITKTKTKKTSGSGGGFGGLNSKSSGVKFSVNAKNENIKSVIKKAPEVMVKRIGYSKGLPNNNLDYISRNGKLELVDSEGRIFKGKEELKDLNKELKMSGVPEKSKKREFLHIMFSMPEGTPAEKVYEAVKNFCKEEFSNRQYFIALHTDTNNPHVHLCVGTRDMENVRRARLSPRRNDWFRYRCGFAEKLRELGVEAAASGRKVRGNYKKSQKSTTRQILADNPKSPFYNKKRADEKIKSGKKLPEPRVPKVIEARNKELGKAVKDKQRPQNPALKSLEAIKEQTIKQWLKVQNNLEKLGEKELVRDLDKFLEKFKEPITSINQSLYDSFIQEQQRERELDNSKSYEHELKIRGI